VKIGSYVVQKGKKNSTGAHGGGGVRKFEPHYFLTMGVHNNSVKQKKIRFSTKILRDYIWHQTTLVTLYVPIHPWTIVEPSGPVWPFAKGVEPPIGPTASHLALDRWIQSITTQHWSSNRLSSSAE